jgi:hypothetical protein
MTTTEEAKKELSKYMSNKRYHQSILDEYTELRARAENTTSILSGLPNRNTSNCRQNGRVYMRDVR